MAKDLEIIKRLEKQIGEKLYRFPIEQTYGSSNGYAVDENQRVIQLNLYNVGLSDISGIKELKYLTKLDLSDNQIWNLIRDKIMRGNRG